MHSLTFIAPTSWFDSKYNIKFNRPYQYVQYVEINTSLNGTFHRPKKLLTKHKLEILSYLIFRNLLVQSTRISPMRSDTRLNIIDNLIRDDFLGCNYLIRINT